MKKIISMFAFIAVLGSLVLTPVNVGRAQVSIDFPMPPINTNTQKPPVATIDLVCMQNAVDKRDTAIITALDAYAAGAKTALQTRKDELKAAWTLTERIPRNTALRAAWKKYRESIRTTRRTFREAKRAAWKQFWTDRKACKTSPVAEDSTGQGIDETL